MLLLLLLIFVGPILLTEAVIGVSKAKKKWLGLRTVKATEEVKQKQGPIAPVMLTEVAPNMITHAAHADACSHITTRM